MTEADLGVKSIPRNPLLFAMLHRMEAVEHIGSGIKRIRNLCREYGVAEPRIEVSEHWFTVIFPRPEVEAEPVIEQVTLQVEIQEAQVEAQEDQLGQSTPQVPRKYPASQVYAHCGLCRGSDAGATANRYRDERS
jgi:ATP-dependent DNA helicase RecG